MKILIIATENNKSKQLMHGLSEQGYEFLDNPFKINEYENNWFDLSKYFKTNKFVVKTITYQKPSSIPNYIVFKQKFSREINAVRRKVVIPGVTESGIEKLLLKDNEWFLSSVNIANKILKETKRYNP